MREILERETCTRPASVFDPLSARVAEDLGFELSMLAGSSASQALLGAPDLVLVTATELADLAGRIGRASPLPLLIDADHGFGNALNVARTVESLEIAGAAAVTIEDTRLPPTYAGAEAQLVSVEEGVGKIRSAIEARVDPSFAIVGRTSAAQITGLADCIARLCAYEAAGADALFVAGSVNPHELEQIASATSLPLVVSPPKENIEAAELKRLRVRIALLGNYSVSAATAAVRDVLMRLQLGAGPGQAASAEIAALMERLCATPAFEDRRRRLLGGG
jgi:carboxyvinyl-carboxyphosphonate phosphorylmutase